MTSSQEIEIRRDGRCMFFTSDLPSNVSGRFVTARRVYDGGVHVQSESLLDANNEGADLGLVEAVVADLTGRGIPVKLSQSLIPQPLDATMDSRKAREYLDGEMVDFVNVNREGVIEYSPRVSPTKLMVQVANAFPDKRIAVLGNSSEEVTSISQQLRSSGIPVTTLVRRQIGDHEHVRRVVVATPFGAEESGVELQQRDLVFFVNARHATHTQAVYEISKSGGCFRLFGFLPIEQRLAKYDRDRLTRIFGFQRIHIPRHGHQATDVRVELFPIRGAGLQVTQSLLDLKRVGVFRNHIRNRLIAHLARQLAAGDTAAYDQLWREIPQDCRTPAVKSVAVVVENVQHVETIRERLRGWTAWSSPKERLLTNNSHVVRSGFGQVIHGDTTKLICTVDGLQTAPIKNTDVFVWAASGSRGPQIPSSRLILPYGADRPVLVIDVVDTQHPQLVAWNHCRQRDYFAREWLPLGWDRHEARIQQFLRARA